jgi:preprotein translocase subunit SecF
MFGVVLVGTYTSVFIASPILIYLGVGTGRMGEVDTPETPPALPTTTPQSPTVSTPPQRARARR